MNSTQPYGYLKTQIGAGRIQETGTQIHLTIPPTSGATYHDAQITTYHTRHDFDLRPPLRLSVTAYAQGDIHGTAGFGFWNHPFSPDERGFRLPKALWFFFGSPPNNMALAQDIAGHGWKAATFDATDWPFLALLPTAPIAFLLMRVPLFYKRLWPIGQWAIGVSETPMDTSMLYEPHHYTLDWLPDRAIFRVDDRIIHETTRIPSAPLGFIAWVDNQYAIVTPQGRFGWGLLDVPHEQTLILQNCSLRNI